MSSRSVQYKVLTGFFLAVLCWNLILFGAWYIGEGPSPSLLMNSLIVLAYSLCFMSFNWPSSKRLITVRIVGMIYSIVMLVLSMLVVNDVIGFVSSWNYIIAGMTLSLALAGIFLIYRVKGFDTTLKQLMKLILMIATVIIFSALGFVYITLPGDPKLYASLETGLTIYSILVLGYFIWIMFSTKVDRSMQKK